MLDGGFKFNIARCLADRGCHVRIFPYNASFSEMQQWQPDGYMLSNGPGDPSAMPEIVNTVKQILEASVPLFGICLGHQLLAEACGMRTYKMHHGHRGINHPVKNLVKGSSEITSQNHGFAVIGEDSSNEPITHINLNDDTIEGIKSNSLPVMAVQYHPESSPGPHDSDALFDRFVELMAVSR